jgi:hypothetical protein
MCQQFGADFQRKKRIMSPKFPHFHLLLLVYAPRKVCLKVKRRGFLRIGNNWLNRFKMKGFFEGNPQTLLKKLF